MLFRFWQEGNHERFSIAKKFFQNQIEKAPSPARGRKRPITQTINRLRGEFDLCAAGPGSYGKTSLPAIDVNGKTKESQDHILPLLMFFGQTKVKASKYSKSWGNSGTTEEDIKALFNSNELAQISAEYNRLLDSADYAAGEASIVAEHPNVIEDEFLGVFIDNLEDEASSDYGDDHTEDIFVSRILDTDHNNDTTP